MKVLVNVARYFTGALFIFSGLVKAIDPLGLAYKMQEFFEAFANDGILPSLMQWLNNYALGFSIVMITLEVVVGVALILGWRKKWTVILLLLLMILFTVLTSYVLFSGKIRACGCFGDCIPLTPEQTFGKDILLLALSLLLLFRLKYIHPVTRPLVITLIVLIAAALTVYLQFRSMKHLPVVDCLPFKPGNHILDLRKMPANAIPDVYDYEFIYQKDGEVKSFTAEELPDESWEFVDRKQKLIKKGSNNMPLINDYNLTTQDGTDVTDSVLNQPNEYYMLYVRYTDGLNESALRRFKDFAVRNNNAQKLYVVVSQSASVSAYLQKMNIPYHKMLTLDATAIKTAARSNPTLYKMKGPVVQQKWGWGDFGRLPE